MTKQEEIRVIPVLNERGYENIQEEINAGVMLIIARMCAENAVRKGTHTFGSITDEVMKYLHSQGMFMEKGRDLTKPSRNYASLNKLEIKRIFHKVGWEDMKKAGFIEFDPLVIEKEPEEDPWDLVDIPPSTTVISCPDCDFETDNTWRLGVHKRKHKKEILNG